MNIKIFIFCLISFIFSSGAIFAQRQMEKLGRGLIAVRQNKDSVYVGWRVLGTDPDDIAFNLYRKTGTSEAVKLNHAPITQSSNFIDASVKFAQANSYFVNRF